MDDTATLTLSADHLTPVRAYAALRSFAPQQTSFLFESLVPPDWPGARANLRHRFESWSAAWVASRQLEGTRGLLLYTLVQVTRSRLTGEGVIIPGKPGPEEQDYAIKFRCL